MAATAAKSLSFTLLFLNLTLFVIAAIVAGWAANYGIEETPAAAARLSKPARLFPIYYPIGNMATGFFVLFSVLAAVVGIAACFSGLANLAVGSVSSLSSAGASSLIAWSLVLLATGVACKEINIGERTQGLRTLETLIIILSGTQLLCAGAIHAVKPKYNVYGGRV